jgi:hypothetical protein
LIEAGVLADMLANPGQLVFETRAGITQDGSFCDGRIYPTRGIDPIPHLPFRLTHEYTHLTEYTENLLGVHEYRVKTTGLVNGSDGTTYMFTVTPPIEEDPRWRVIAWDGNLVQLDFSGERGPEPKPGPKVERRTAWEHLESDL